MADRQCADGKGTSNPELEKWQSEAIAEAYEPDKLKVRSIGPTPDTIKALPNQITHVESGGRVAAGTNSVIVAHSGALVGAQEKSVVVAKAGSVIYANCASRVVAEAGSEVVAYAGAKVDAKPGAAVLDVVPGADLIDRRATRAGLHTEISNAFGRGSSMVQIIVTKDSNVTTHHQNTIAEAGASVTAEAYSTVLAQPGSRVRAMRGSTVYATPGADVQRERGAEVFEARGFLGQEYDKQIKDILPGGQIIYHIRGQQKFEALARQHIITNAEKVVARQGAWVEAYRQRELTPQSVLAEGGSVVSAGGNTSVVAERGSKVEVSGVGAHAVARPGSSVVAKAGASVLAETGSDVYVRSGARVERADKGANIRYEDWIDRLRAKWQ